MNGCSVDIEMLLDSVLPDINNGKSFIDDAYDNIMLVKCPEGFSFKETLNNICSSIKTCCEDIADTEELILNIAQRWASTERLNGEIIDQLTLWNLFLEQDEGKDVSGKLSEQIKLFLEGMDDEELQKLLEDLKKNGNKEPTIYNQLAYGHIGYGPVSNVQRSGCGPVSTAMSFADLLNDPEITIEWIFENYPDIGKFNTKGKGTNKIFEYIVNEPGPIKDQGVTLEEYKKRQDAWGDGVDFNNSNVMNALRNGSKVVALVQANSIFTDGGHFIYLEGINEQGNIIVRDPNGQNYIPRDSTLSNGLGKPAPNTDDTTKIPVEGGYFDPMKPFELAEEGERFFTRIFL